MCGLVGLIANRVIHDQMVAVFSQLLEVDIVRGRHSTGVVRLDKKGMKYYKKAVDGVAFVNSVDGDKFIYGGKETRALWGHNRWATKGEINHVNAHPFRHGHITLMHNGTLKSMSNLPDGKDFEVDSECIAHSMAKIGEKETLEKLNGAYALVWYNSEDGTINFARNSERPLWFATTSQGNIFFGSERGMLDWILTRNNCRVDKWKALPTHEQWKVKLDKWQVTEDDVVKTPFKEHNPWSYCQGNKADNSAHSNYSARTVERDKMMREFPPGSWQDVYVYATKPYRGRSLNGVGIASMMDEPYSNVELVDFPMDAPMGHYEVMVGTWRTEYHARKTNTTMISRMWKLIDAEDNTDEVKDMADTIDKCKEADDQSKKQDSNVIVLPGGATNSETTLRLPSGKGSTETTKNIQGKRITKRLVAQKLRELTTPEINELLKRVGCKYLKDLNPRWYARTYELACQVREGKLILGNTPKRDVKVSKDIEELKGEDLVMGPRNVLIPVAEYDKLTKYGCTNCGGNIMHEDAEDVFWGTHGTVYCPGCVQEFLEWGMMGVKDDM